MPDKVEWLGKTACDCCQVNVRRVLYDAKTKFGPWATMCEACFLNVGVGLGTGKGQRYVRDDPDDKFVKVEG